MIASPYRATRPTSRVEEIVSLRDGVIGNPAVGLAAEPRLRFRRPHQLVLPVSWLTRAGCTRANLHYDDGRGSRPDRRPATIQDAKDRQPACGRKWRHRPRRARFSVKSFPERRFGLSGEWGRSST